MRSGIMLHMVMGTAPLSSPSLPDSIVRPALHCTNRSALALRLGHLSDYI